MTQETISMLHEKDIGNLILHQIIQGHKISIQEVKPPIEDKLLPNTLVLNEDNVVSWKPYFNFCDSKTTKVLNNKGVLSIDVSINNQIIQDGKLKDTSIYYLNQRIGIGRSPLLSYVIDVAVPQNRLMTAFHIGDGTFGFSMGNGTTQGFIPEIIGMGSDENDAGLYFIGKSGNNIGSNIPMIILDGRSNSNKIIKNRPLLGITNADYYNYKVVVNYNGDTVVNGKITATDFSIDNSIFLTTIIGIIFEQKSQIDNLNKRVQYLESIING